MPSHIGRICISRESKYGKACVVTEDKLELPLIGEENIRPALHGDLVEIIQLTDNQGWRVSKIVEAKEHREIPGILLIKSQIIHGTNKKGHPIYRCRITDPRYPNVLVPSTLKNKIVRSGDSIRNHYILTDFIGWEGNICRGICNSVLGPVGDLSAEYEHTLFRWGLQQPSMKNLSRKNPELHKRIQGDLEECNNNNLDLGDRTLLDVPQYHIFSIDPDGCEDIDDALHFQETADFYEVGVHIADVSRWIHEDTLLDRLARERLSTIYAPYKRIDMLPEEYATKICSLSEAQLRFAMSTFYYFAKGDFSLQKVEFHETLIRNQKALTYEQADKIIKKTKGILGTSLQGLAKVVENSPELRGFRGDESLSHQIVSVFMILTNKTVAEAMCNSPLSDRVITRTHKSSPPIGKIEEVRNQSLRQYLMILGMEGAEYSCAADPGEHHALGIKHYVHFTSPIRRYVDLWNHRIFKAVMMREKEVLLPFITAKLGLGICQAANELNKRIHAAEREFKLLGLIAKWESSSQYENKVETAYVTNLDPVQIFFPTFKLCLKVDIVHEKIKNLITIPELALFQEILVKIVPNIQAENLRNKVKLQIIEPELEVRFLEDD